MVFDNDGSIEIEDDASTIMIVEDQADADADGDDDAAADASTNPMTSTATSSSSSTSSNSNSNSTTRTTPLKRSSSIRRNRRRSRSRVRVLEERKRFSKSIIWDMMSQFYDKQGVKAWTHNIVPSFITSNAAIGRSYARVIVSFFSDWIVQANVNVNANDDDDDKTMYIVELGGGSGKLCFYILRALDQILQTQAQAQTQMDTDRYNRLDVRNIVYVLTDFTESNVSYWETHPSLQHYVHAGRLDFALFDATSDTSLTCRVSGNVLNNGEVDVDASNINTTNGKTTKTTNQTKHPICIVANYLVDTLCQDLFQVDPHGILREGLVTVSVEEEDNPQQQQEGEDEDEDDGCDYGGGGEEEEEEENDGGEDQEEGNNHYMKDQQEGGDGGGIASNSIIHNFSNEYSYEPINTNYYDQHVPPCDRIHFERILSWYQRYFSSSSCSSSTANATAEDSSSSVHQHQKEQHAATGATFLLPIGFINAIRNVSNLSQNGRALILVGDKGTSNPQRMEGICDPHIAFHGSFSVMANFHALALYVLSRGGFTLMNAQEEASLQVNAYVLTGQHHGTDSYNDDDESNKSRDDNGMNVDLSHHCLSLQMSLGQQQQQQQMFQFPLLRNAFEDHINHFGPNDFYAMQRSLKDEANPSLLCVVALLRLSNWDPDIFFKFRDIILTEVSKPSCSIMLRSDLLHGAGLIWKNFFFFPDRDYAFELGRLYFGLHEFDKALDMYSQSNVLFGEHHITYHNSGLCHSSMKNYEEAKKSFRKSLEMQPDYAKAATWLEKITILAGKS